MSDFEEELGADALQCRESLDATLFIMPKIDASVLAQMLAGREKLPNVVIALVRRECVE